MLWNNSLKKISRSLPSWNLSSSSHSSQLHWSNRTHWLCLEFRELGCLCTLVNCDPPLIPGATQVGPEAQLYLECPKWLLWCFCLPLKSIRCSSSPWVLRSRLPGSLPSLWPDLALSNGTTTGVCANSNSAKSSKCPLPQSRWTQQNWQLHQDEVTGKPRMSPMTWLYSTFCLSFFTLTSSLVSKSVGISYEIL